VHRITKRTNYWFEREVHVIERNAEQWAKEWAERGLPRHDVPRTEALQPEQVLAKLCGQLFRDWQLRVRTKMQDAIAETGRVLGEHIATLRARISRLETIRLELTEREQRIEKLRRETEKDERPVKYGKMIPGWGFWLGAFALGCVEFMANFPVFRLLLPMNSALAKVAGSIADNVNDSSLGAGGHLLLMEWATHIEAVIVAMVAVVVLVVLGKFAGRAARAWFALDPQDHAAASMTIRAHRREFAVKGGLSFAGLLCVLGFLFASRGGIAELTAERVKQDRSAVEASEARLKSIPAESQSEIIAESQKLMQLRDALAQHEEDNRYAATVQTNNWPILFLNLALVITAAVLGYAAAQADLGEKRGEHPDLVKLREKCVELQGQQLAVDHEARAAAGQAHMAVSRVGHLLNAHPLRGWESKVQRLMSVVPRFRGENARLRGLDPANIKAFDTPPELDLPPVNEQLELVEPAEFRRLRDELQELELALAHLAPRPSPRAAGAAA